MSEQDKARRDEVPAASIGASLAPPLRALDRPPAKPEQQPVAPVRKPSAAPPTAAGQVVPTLPLSMSVRPATSDRDERPEARFPGELDEDFESALGRVDVASAGARAGRSAFRWMRWAGRMKSGANLHRRVAFDGFRSTLHDEKIERDRRYGTVYTVVEHKNAYLVTLELPRLLPGSALQSVWQLGRAMPDYDYNVRAGGNFLIIKGSVAGEALRRLSYVSASFPADFMTQIDFPKAIDGFVHRLRDKMIELVVFKAASNSGPAAD